MFHEGSLQSGISRAIQEQKVVACFVRDEGEESSTWENEWLPNGWISNLLEQKAILLRIQAGSQEAGFLSAFCPLTTIPTLLVIQNGQLQQQLVAGASKEEFINSLRKALGATAIPSASLSTASQAHQVAVVPQPSATPTDSGNERPATATEQRIPVSPILPPSRKAKGKEKAAPVDSNTEQSATRAAQSARDALRKKKQEEKQELARIKARIEADKAERKAEAEARKAERERLASAATTASPVPSAKGNSRSQSAEVHLNVRLFDGRTIRSTFPRTSKLQDNVRPWIDDEVKARAESFNQNHPPYYFKQILAPLPSRELSAGEENETLGDLGLAPSATLVLVPIKGYTEAYENSGGGAVSSVLGGVTGLVGEAFSLAHNAASYAANALGAVVGYGAPPPQGSTQAAASERVPASPATDNLARSGIRVRTLADQRESQPRQELYNGNQLNFEPNHDEHKTD
ncbi:hypothetical protein M011DRAFT_394345 [Sporormia fimetaria CBS 119925]|uniref:UBX domain-containing protein 2 n=1 Tax=Sporormia fimetaria CBS 119925 TaxID=1340428 RepID=A0A6A6VNX2_9PLEO|nr:hypothetical protein M011DRAFT_394345 [Sporormia fimetaria CBS 119925]